MDQQTARLRGRALPVALGAAVALAGAVGAVAVLHGGAPRTPSTGPLGRPSPSVSAASSPSDGRPCGPLDWELVNVPDPGHAWPAGVLTLADDDAWAVGSTDDPRSTGLAEHWDGRTWSVVPTPPTASPQSVLVDADGDSPDDLWAVGWTAGRPGARSKGNQALIEHWDGSRWSLVDPPDTGTRSLALSSVSASGPADVWAVGTLGPELREEPVVLHWDGRRWDVVPRPPVGDLDRLTDIAAAGPNDVWAVGFSLHRTAPGHAPRQKVLVERWDGSAWREIDVPVQGVSVFADQITAVAARGGQAWLAGYHAVQGHSPALVLHWDGSSWHQTNLPHSAARSPELMDVAVASSAQAWVVGWMHVGNEPRQVMDRWDGTAWHPSTSPEIQVPEANQIDAGRTLQVEAVSAGPSGAAWAVGGWEAGPGQHQAFFLHHRVCG